MRSTSRRPFAAVVLAAVVAVATLGAACTTGPGGEPQPPEQPVFDWVARAQTLHVIDDNNDNFACDGVNLNCDEPYLYNLSFRVQYAVPNSAVTWVVEDMPNELKCPGAPPSVLGLQPDSCKSGESATIPAAMGEIFFDDLKGADVLNVLSGQLPEIAGVITFAFEEDVLSGKPNTTLLENLVRDLLNDIIASGNLPQSGGQDAATALVGDILQLFGEFLTNEAIELLAGVGLFDDFVGLSPTIIAGVTGTLASLVQAVEIDGVSFAEIPVLNGRVFTTAAPSSFTTTYTLQSVEVGGLGTVEFGDAGTRYDVDWMVGSP